MANLYKSIDQKDLKEFPKFCRAYFPVSIVVTLVLIFLTYKDIVFLRFGGSFFGETALYDDNVMRLLSDGYSAKLLRATSDNFSIIALSMIFAMIAYSVVSTYKRTYRNLNMSSNYVNAKRSPSVVITTTNMALYSLSFVLPVLFWFFYITVWFPALVKLPLKFIMSSSPLTLITTALGTIALIILLTQLGIIITRLAMKVFRRA